MCLGEWWIILCVLGRRGKKVESPDAPLGRGENWISPCASGGKAFSKVWPFDFFALGAGGIPAAALRGNARDPRKVLTRDACRSGQVRRFTTWLNMDAQARTQQQSLCNATKISQFSKHSEQMWKFNSKFYSLNYFLWTGSRFEKRIFWID